MNQEQFEQIPTIVANLKKQCNYIKGRSCRNCKHFGTISGMGYGPEYYYKDERNQVPGMERSWTPGMSVEPDGLCNYWELTDGRLF